jgi:shikimate dehydrogenase
LYRAAFAAAGVAACYVAIRTWNELVGSLMRDLASRGGGGNVTLPHKARAARNLDASSRAVQATGACNTFWWDAAHGLCGDNTDVDGFRAAARHLVGGELADARVLVLGAGGAARAVCFACLSDGIGRVDLLNRTRSRAEVLKQDMGSPRQLRILPDMSGATGAYDLVVNATSLGLDDGDPAPLDPRVVRAGALIDLVYRRGGETPLVRAVREAGWRAEDGRRMLVEQAAAAFERWFGRSAPREAMRRAVELA